MYSVVFLTPLRASATITTTFQYDDIHNITNRISADNTQTRYAYDIVGEEYKYLSQQDYEEMVGG